MRDVTDAIDRWLGQGKKVALATVVETWGSGPRGAGAKMAMTADADIAGSVSGGCVEGAVVQAGREVLTGGAARLLHFGVADESAWSVGLACGGTIDVFVQPLDRAVYSAVKDALATERPFAVVTSLADGSAHLATGDESALARDALLARRSRRVEAEGRSFFVDVQLPPPRLVVVGGVHIAIALTTMARAIGFWTAIVDPRQVFGSQARFPDVDSLIQEWPDEAFARLGLTASTAVTTLTHDPKIDDASLKIALPSPVFYIGALGSRKTQERRRKRLLEAGLTESQVDRIHAPIGLEIGAQTPEEIALSILAQVVSNWRQGAG